MFCGYCRLYDWSSQKSLLPSKALCVDQVHSDTGEMNLITRNVDQGVKAVAAEPQHPRMFYRYATELQELQIYEPVGQEGGPWQGHGCQSQSRHWCLFARILNVIGLSFGFKVSLYMSMMALELMGTLLSGIRRRRVIHATMDMVQGVSEFAEQFQSTELVLIIFEGLYYLPYRQVDGISSPRDYYSETH